MSDQAQRVTKQQDRLVAIPDDVHAANIESDATGTCRRCRRRPAASADGGDDRLRVMRMGSDRHALDTRPSCDRNQSRCAKAARRVGRLARFCDRRAHVVAIRTSTSAPSSAGWQPACRRTPRPVLQPALPVEQLVGIEPFLPLVVAHIERETARLDQSGRARFTVGESQ